MRPLFLHNGRDAAGELQILRIADGRITAPLPQSGDLFIDLGGDRLLPGLVNAHDHLQLNGLPRLKYREAPYANASEWIADITPRLHADPLLQAYRAHSRIARLLIGGVKNLLSGVTTVAQHEPFEPELANAPFPVRVPDNLGFAHSLALDGDAAVQASRERHAAGLPWVIHAGEGTDDAARAEFDRLDALGCLRADSVFVHGLAFSLAQQQRLVRSGAGVVWCPGSNLHLFGRTLDPERLFRERGLALGSDSRISGECDLLHELALAQQLTRWDEAALESLVTDRAADVLALNDRGRLATGELADLIVLPAWTPLFRVRRGQLRLVLVGGEARYADDDFAAQFGAHAELDAVEVDDRPRRLWRPLVRALRNLSELNELNELPLREPGLRLDLHSSEPPSCNAAACC